MIEPISAVGMNPTREIEPLNLVPVNQGPGFIGSIEQGAASLNTSLNQAESATRALAAGQDVPVHQVMISLEQARLDLQFTVQVRNRVLAAYHDIIGMQV